MLAEADLCSRCGEPHSLRSSFCSHCGLRRGASQSDDLFAPTVPGPWARAEVEDRSWSAIRSVGVFFSLLVGTSIVSGFAERIHSTPWNVAISTIALAVVVVLFAALNWELVAPYCRAPRCDRNTAGQLLLGVLVVTFCLHLYFLGLGHLVKILPAGADMRRANWQAGSIYFFVCVMPAVFEEIACRGIIQGKLEPVLSRRDALLIQAGLFSILHLLPLVFLSHFVMGIGLGILRNKTRSLYPGMLTHGLWNAFILSCEMY